MLLLQVQINLDLHSARQQYVTLTAMTVSAEQASLASQDLGHARLAFAGTCDYYYCHDHNHYACEYGCSEYVVDVVEEVTCSSGW